MPHIDIWADFACPACYLVKPTDGPRWRCVPACRAAGSGGEFLAGAVTGSRDQEFRAGAGACRGRARSG
jgi:hypothetical protein